MLGVREQASTIDASMKQLETMLKSARMGGAGEAPPSGMYS
jgi:hypothetical protein